MQHRTRTKYCGISSEEDALFAAELGVDALGFVFYPESPRYLRPQAAGAIINKLPPFITTVGLFVDESKGGIEETIRQTGIDLVQFHGEESPEFCAAISRPYFKALKVKEGEDTVALAVQYKHARGILVDAYVAGIAGGSGQTFDWNRIPEEFAETLANPLIVAGGLNVENVGPAIQRFRPNAVDVSSGIEISPGVKDKSKMQAFMREVKKYDGK